MSLQTRLTALAQAIAADIKALYANQGTLANLTTTQKSNLVGAINEVLAAVATATQIDDSTASTSKTYSSSKVVALLAALKAEILGGASAAYDTLKEIQDILASDDTAISGLLTAVGNRVRFDAAQSLTGTQMQTARDNIGAQDAASIGDTAHDFVADYNAAKA